MDSKRNELIRSQETESYKQNRKNVDPILAQQFEHIFDSINKMNIQSCKVVGYEADDVIATLCHNLSKEHEIIIISSDKDMNQLLVYDNVKIYNPMKKEFFSHEDCFNKYKIHPHQFTFYQAFIGDISDNIQGIKGVGPKTAIKLITQYETIENFTRDTKSNTKSKYYDNIDDFEKSLKLVTLKIDLDLPDIEHTKQNFKNKEFKEFCALMEIK